MNGRRRVWQATPAQAKPPERIPLPACDSAWKKDPV
jgi:hypothetical protein